MRSGLNLGFPSCVFWLFSSLGFVGFPTLVYGFSSFSLPCGSWCLLNVILQLKQLRGISNTFGLAFSNSYSSFQSGGFSNANVFDEFSPGYSSEDMERLRVQDVGEGRVKIRCFW